MPLFSVVVPCRNRGDRLSMAIESALSQDFDDLEILVVDDGSTEDIAGVCSKFGEKVRYLRKEATGAAASRNLGAEEAKGKYLAFLDSDDTWLEHKLSEQVKYLKLNPNTRFLYSDATVCASGDKELRVSEQRKPYSGWVQRDLVRENFICTSTVVVEAELFAQSNGFKERFQPAEDYDLWLRLAEQVEFHYQDEPLARYSVDADAVSRDLERMFAGQILVLEELDKKKLGIGKERFFTRRLSNLNYFLSQLAVARGKKKQARKNLLESIRYRPVFPKAYVHYATTFLGEISVRSARKYIQSRKFV